MALAIIAIAAIAMAGLARRSLRLSLESKRAEEDLQRRWGLVSCRRVILENAESLLESLIEPPDARPQAWPVPRAWTHEARLGEIQFTLSLADETAKVNLNTQAKGNHEQAERVVTRVLAAGPTSHATAALRPPPSDRETRFASWGDVFGFPVEIDNREAAAQIRNLTQEITCWGSTRLNLRRASDEAVRLACAGVVSEQATERLLALRKTGAALSDILARASLNGVEAGRARRLFTAESSCYSLWVATAAGESRHDSLSLLIMGDADRERLDFYW